MLILFWIAEILGYFKMTFIGSFDFDVEKFGGN